MLFALITVSGLLVLSLGGVGLLWAVHRADGVAYERLKRDNDTLGSARDQAERQRQEQAVTIAGLNEKIAGFDQRLEAQRRQHEQIQAQAQAQFKALAGEALSKANKEFLNLASERFDTKQQDATVELDQRKRSIDQMLKPIRESLDKHARAVGEIDAKREKAYGNLSQHLTMLQQAQESLGKEAQALGSALKGSPTVRGRWGEMTLRRIAEMAGMVDHCDFDEQVTLWKGESQQRPDMVVNLPSDRLVIVDAKAVGESYFKAAESEDEARRGELLAQHLKDIESRVTDLSRKAYWSQLERTPDFVVMFLPSESLLYSAVERRHDLTEWAMANKVVITTPTTLIGLLKVMELGWREEKIAKGAEEIATLGQDLHKRMATLLGHINKLGGYLGSATDHYNKLVGSVERNVLPQTRRFEELGAKSAGQLPADGAIKIVGSAPRLVGTQPPTADQ